MSSDPYSCHVKDEDAEFKCTGLERSGNLVRFKQQLFDDISFYEKSSNGNFRN